ncbi:MAG: hypothetical protein MJ239_06200 [Bacilli bacterium]|nr:hypothetical protein [Bacilli bacterium]
MSLFPYDEVIRSHLFQFKGCFDYELGEIFLSRASAYLKILFHGYSIVPAPSFWLKDEKRGFNHVEKMFDVLGLPMIRAIIKTEDIKQSDLSSRERTTVSRRLAWIPGVDIKGKKILFVDDVYTTGSTVKACLKMIKDHHPKGIKVLVMSKTVFKG